MKFMVSISSTTTLLLLSGSGRSLFRSTALSSSKFNVVRSMSTFHNVESPKTLSVALCQLAVGSDKAQNIANAAEVIDSSAGAELVV